MGTGERRWARRPRGRRRLCARPRLVVVLHGTLDVSADSAAPGSALFIARGTTAVTLTAGTLELRGGHRLGPLSVAPGARLRALGSATVEGALSVPAGASLHLESLVALDRMALPPRIDGHLAVLTDLASPADLVLGGTMSLDARFTVGSLEVLPGASVTHSPGVRTMHLIATRTLRVAVGGRIDVSGKGLASETTIIC